MADRSTRERPLAPQPRRAPLRVPRRPPVGGRYRSNSPPSTRRAPSGGGGLPWPARLVLVVAILALGGSVLLVASGMIGSAVTDFGHTLQSMFGAVTGPVATAAPTAVARPDAPHLVVPTDPYTQLPAWDVSGFAPHVRGRPGCSVRIYVNGHVAQQQQLRSAPPTQRVRGAPSAGPLGDHRDHRGPRR